MSHWYSFILGRVPELSLAELKCVLSVQTSFTVIESSAHFFVIETPVPLDTIKLMNILGGTIKIGEGLAVFSDTKCVTEQIAQTLINRAVNEQKIYFGVSAYSPLPLNLNSYRLGLEIKTILKKTFNRSSRLVSSHETTLSSVVVATNKLLSSRGAELQIFFIHNKLYVARTSAVQNFAEFSKRDYERPAADPKSGMLPPKVARIMLNLARVKIGEILLDPFCGSGTIIMEAAILHPRNKLYGSDVSKQAIQNTLKNFNWLKQRYPLAGQNLSLFQNSIETFETKLQPHSIDAIITEPYLGPPLRGATNKTTLDGILKSLNPLYETILSVFNTLLKSRGCVVMVWPVFAHQKNWLELPAFSMIKKYFDFEHLSTQSPGILYARPNQKVGRLIVKLKKRS